MSKPNKDEVVVPFKLGDRVRIKHYHGGIGRIAEFRGPLGPGGALIYRVLVQRKPTLAYIELLGDQIEIVTVENKVKRSKIVTKAPKGD